MLLFTSPDGDPFSVKWIMIFVLCFRMCALEYVGNADFGAITNLVVVVVQCPNLLKHLTISSKNKMKNKNEATFLACTDTLSYVS